MVDIMLNFIRKSIETVLIAAVVLGFFNFIRSPGDLANKLKSSYELTRSQGEAILSALSNERDELVQNIGSNMMKQKEEREKLSLVE